MPLYRTPPTNGVVVSYQERSPDALNVLSTPPNGVSLNASVGGSVQLAGLVVLGLLGALVLYSYWMH